MGANPLEVGDGFWDDMEDVIFLCIKKDKTINMKTSVKDMDQLKSIFTTAFMMALFHDMKSDPEGIDKLH